MQHRNKEVEKKLCIENLFRKSNITKQKSSPNISFYAVHLLFTEQKCFYYDFSLLLLWSSGFFIYMTMKLELHHVSMINFNSNAWHYKNAFFGRQTSSSMFDIFIGQFSYFCIDINKTAK